MNSNLRYGQNKGKDLEYLVKKDDLNLELVKKFLKYKQYIIIENKEGILGFLRYQLFWGTLPNMEMIRIEKEVQKNGLGTKLYNFWEAEMISQGFKKLMTSSVKNENEPQEWHKRNGFLPTGEIVFGKNKEDHEVFFIKTFS